MSTPDTGKLETVRKLLAKAEAEGVTPEEAELFTAKAAELMAKYGIDRARLGALHPETDKPGNKVIDIENPWAQVRAHLLAGIAKSMGCDCVLLSAKNGARIHLFGFESDLERTDILYTSLLLQMAHGLSQVRPPREARSPRAWRRSWLLGFVTAVVARIRLAEERALDNARTEDRASNGPSTVVALRDRAATVRKNLADAYPVTRNTRLTYSGRGYSDGYATGQRADIGGARLKSTPALR